jgi:hypothetical protein
MTISHAVYFREDMLTLTREAYFEMCPIKGPNVCHKGIVKETKEDADCSSSYCK